MCAIIGWSGKMPTGLLFQLLIAAEHRGRDSTGIGYLDPETGRNITLKQAVPADVFIEENREKIAKLSKAAQGIAHTRRASKSMPINNRNAHPFIYKAFVFAHNGALKNWRALVNDWIGTNETSNAPDSDYLAEYLEKVTTDSMALGPLIERRNFAPAFGSFGLVWLYGNDAYAFRSKKELTSAKIVWSYANAPEETHMLTLVASTWEIITAALAKTANLRYDAENVLLEENHIYKFSSTGIADEGEVPVNAHNQVDAFTSAADSEVKPQTPK